VSVDGGWGDWIKLHRSVWRRIAVARTRPERAGEAWPLALTGGSPPSGEGDQLYHHILALGRTSFGVELAFERLMQACEDFNSLVGFGGDDAVAEAGFRMSNELHAFFVCADAFWDNLRALARAMPGLAELARARSEHAPAADVARTARDHLEHLAERIETGRGEKFGLAMTAQTFRRVSGGFDGTSAYFGDEEFDVPAVREAVAEAAEVARTALIGVLGVVDD